MNHSELEGQDFFAKYLNYTGGTEVPTFFNRWACIGGLGAWAMQDIWFPFGAGKIYPNIYAMLVGDPGSRKSTAIKSMKSLLKEAGYSYFAGEKTSKEKFLEDLASNNSGGAGDDLSRVDAVLFGDYDSEATPCMIAADEFADFFGNNTMEFVSLLGVLWDFSGVYNNKTKSGQTSINNPNISILGGNTVDTLCRTFPPEVMGQGFFSRILFIHGEANGRKIAFPRIIPDEDTIYMRNELLRVRESFAGQMVASPEAYKAMETIYTKFKGLSDIRFASYSTRRFTHFIKLVMIHAAADYSRTIELPHVIRANTILTHAEHHMPRALGEFGRSRNSAVVHKIMQVVERTTRPLDMSEIWKEVQGDMDRINELGEAIKGLLMSGKIQSVDGGFLPIKAVQIEYDSPLYDWDYLTDEERNI